MPTLAEAIFAFFIDHASGHRCSFIISDASRCKEVRTWCVVSLANPIATRRWRLTMIYISPLIKFRRLFVPNSLAKSLRNDARMPWFFSCILQATWVYEWWLRLCSHCVRSWILVDHFLTLNTIILICWQMDGVWILVFLFGFRADQFVHLCAIFKALLLRKVHHCGCGLWWNETVAVI